MRGSIPPATEGCIYSDPRHDQQLSLGPFACPQPAEELRRRLDARGEWRHLAQPGQLLGGALPCGPPHDVIPRPHREMNHGGPVWPDNVHETGVSPGWTVWVPHRGRRSGTGRANSKIRPGHGPDPRFLCPIGCQERPIGFGQPWPPPPRRRIFSWWGSTMFSTSSSSRPHRTTRRSTQHRSR